MELCKEKECPSFGQKKGYHCGCNRDDVTLKVTMSREKAKALAQFLKRVGFSDFEEHATSTEEVYLMLNGAYDVRVALEEAGIVVR